MTNLAELIERLRAKEHRGQFAVGGGTVSYDGRATTWGGEKIFELRNPDGPEAADELERLQALAQAAGYTDVGGALRDVARLKAVSAKSRLVNCYIEPRADQDGPMFWDNGDGDFGFNLEGYNITPNANGGPHDR